MISRTIIRNCFMQVTQEKRPGSQVSLNITLDVEQVKKAYEKTVRDLTKTIQLQGFRKGKAPRHMVVQYLGPLRVKAAALEDLINEAVEAALKEVEIDAIGQFNIEGGLDTLLTHFDPKTELSFAGTIDVKPEVTLGTYTNLEVKAERQMLDPAKVSDTIDEQRQQRATLLPVEDRAAAMGDVTIVDFVGRTLDGEEIEGARAEDFQLELEESKFIPGFVAGIVGMEIDEEREVEAQFPEDYASPEVAGKAAKFTVKLHEIKVKELPELNDEFVSEISDFSSVEALQQHLTERFTADADRQSASNWDEALMEAVLEGVEMELPETMIEQEVQFLINQSFNQLAQQGLDPKSIVTDQMMSEMKERTRPDAIARLRRTLTLAEIVRQEKIQVGETELAVKVEDFLNSYRGQEKISEQRVRDYFREELLSEKIFIWLKEQNQVEWVDADGNSVEAPNLDDEVGKIDIDSIPTSTPGETAEPPAATAEEAVVEAEFSTVDTDSEPES